MNAADACLPMSRFPIRVPKPEEAPQLAAFMRTCYLAAYGDVAPPGDTAVHLERAYGDGLVAAGLADAGMRFLVVTDTRDAGPADAGYAWLVETPAPEPLVEPRGIELRRFYLHPDAIGSGAADVLMDAVRAAARQRLARLLFLSVWKESHRAVRFYGRHGFRAHATVTFSIGSQRYDDWLMARVP